MSSHFSPSTAPDRPCWHCRHFERVEVGSGAALCLLVDGPRRRALPARGCSAWERQPGADDESGQPAAVDGAGGTSNSLAARAEASLISRKPSPRST
jgi:hypothetical protein